MRATGRQMSIKAQLKQRAVRTVRVMRHLCAVDLYEREVNAVNSMLFGLELISLQFLNNYQ
jgi:hypothetical protein